MRKSPEEVAFLVGFAVGYCVAGVFRTRARGDLLFVSQKRRQNATAKRGALIFCSDAKSACPRRAIRNDIPSIVTLLLGNATKITYTH